MRLIDADAYQYSGDLVNEPTIDDAVVVVRCENCMYGTEFVDNKGVLRICGLRDDHRFPVCHDDFCSNGVRKED